MVLSYKDFWLVFNIWNQQWWSLDVLRFGFLYEFENLVRYALGEWRFEKMVYGFHRGFVAWLFERRSLDPNNTWWICEGSWIEKDYHFCLVPLS